MQPIKILICEDDRLLAVDLESRLVKFGHQVVGMVSTGEEAVARIGEFSPELVMMDIELDGKMTGIETAEVLFTNHYVPSVFLTAFNDDVTIERAKKSKPLGYLIKPVGDRELQNVVEFGYSHHRLERMLNKKLDEYKEFLQDVGYVDDSASQPYFSVAHSKPNIQAISRILGKLADCIQMSHESIHTHLDWLANCDTLGAYEKRQVQSAINGLHEQENIMQQLLWTAQLSSRTFMPAQLMELVDLASQRVSSYLSNRITLKTTSDLEDDSIYVDREAIITAIECVIRNAIESIDGDGKIEISVGRQKEEMPEQFNPKSLAGEYFVIIVKDTGKGFNYGVADKIFEPFFTTHQSLKSHGLGLSATFGIMQSHGGWITLESEKDKGSTFRLFLPPSEEKTARVKESIDQIANYN